MRTGISVIYFIVFLAFGCSKSNTITPLLTKEETENKISTDIENKYGIHIKDKNGISEVLAEFENRDKSILTITCIKNEDLWVGVFDLNTKKELGSFALDSEPIVTDLGYGDKKEIVPAAITILNKTSTHIYGYKYYSLKGDKMADSYQLFAGEIGSNKNISDNLFGNYYYFWSASGLVYDIKPWYDNHILIESNLSYPDRKNGYFIVGDNNKIKIDGSGYSDYFTGLNIQSAVAFNKTVIALGNDISVYDLETNTYNNIGIAMDKEDRWGIEDIKTEGNTATVRIKITAFSGKTTEKTVKIDLENYKEITF